MGLMSDEGHGAADSGVGNGNTTRVGNAERDAAVTLLEEHWHAGRLDPAEHELRITRARAAVTQADLDVLFTDLPVPSPATVSTGEVTVQGAGGFLENKRDTIIALTPFAALALFFLAGHNWMWFLMVPVMGILMYGPGGGRHAGYGRDRGRNRNRGC
jgi:Domain of unknown function (DUF1707)